MQFIRSNSYSFTCSKKERNITAESRALKAASLEKELDTINSFDMVSNYCSKFSPEDVVDVSESNVIKILKLKDFPPEVEYSIRIKDDFQVEAHLLKVLQL